MSYECFEVTLDSHIAHVKLNRPDKRNAMNLVFWDELPKIVRTLDEKSQTRVMVLSSTGPHFCAGLDINAFFSQSVQDSRDERTKKITSGAEFYERVQLMQQSFTVLEQARFPVLAAVQGGCIGGGVDLATACDMRYASQDAYFKIEEINIGMTADVGTFPRLAKLIPDGFLREYSYTGAAISAQHSERLGLVNRVFADHETMLDQVMDIAREIATKAPMAIRGTKKIINYSRDHSVTDALDYIAIWNASHLQPEEIMEAIAARSQDKEGQFVDLPPKKSTLS